MQKRPFKKRLRRLFVVVLLAIFIALFEAVSFILHAASDLVQRFVRFVGLAPLEKWLKRQPVWFAMTLVVAMFLGSWVFKVYELRLMFTGRLVTALSLAALFKIVWLGLMNYLFHLYGEQFLSVRWIKYLYDRYQFLKRYVYDYLARTAAYRLVRRIKSRLSAVMKKRKTMQVVSRMARRTRT